MECSIQLGYRTFHAPCTHENILTIALINIHYLYIIVNGNHHFDMMKTMPGIEFNQGIPEDIGEPDYLDVSQRNLIVLDDLMA